MKNINKKSLGIVILLLAGTGIVGWFVSNPNAGISEAGHILSVIGVSATSPILSSGGTNPVISMAKATSSANGYLGSSDWSLFNGKYSLPGGCTVSQLIDGTGACQTIPILSQYWYNGTLQTSVKKIAFTGTLSSGTDVFYLTNGGTLGGTALCSTAPVSVTVTVNDPSNIYGWSYAVTNSNKTLTVSVNQRNFSGVTVVGISVLGGTSIGSAPNGTLVSAVVECY